MMSKEFQNVKFSVHERNNLTVEVENAFVREIARRGHGAVEVKICPTSME